VMPVAETVAWPPRLKPNSSNRMTERESETMGVVLISARAIGRTAARETTTARTTTEAAMNLSSCIGCHEISWVRVTAFSRGRGRGKPMSALGIDRIVACMSCARSHTNGEGGASRRAWRVLWMAMGAGEDRMHQKRQAPRRPELYRRPLVALLIFSLDYNGNRTLSSYILKSTNLEPVFDLLSKIRMKRKTRMISKRLLDSIDRIQQGTLCYFQIFQYAK
jgi:hypothetical protein